MKGYRFTIHYNGFGDDEDDAWDDLLNNISLYPPVQPAGDYVQEVCADCGFPYDKCMCEPTDDEIANNDPNQMGSDAWLEKGDIEYERQRDEQIDKILEND